MGLKTLKTFDNSVEAHIFKSRLENESITCYLFDDTMISLNYLYHQSLGGIKLKVSEYDLKKGLEIVGDIDNTPLLNSEGELVKCPKCSSSELYLGYKSMNGVVGVFSFLLSFLVTMFPLFYKTLNKCKSCGNEFKYESINL